MVVSPSTVVHGMSIGDVSPVKESRIKNGVKLFESRFTDEKKVDKLHTSTFTSYPEPFKVKDFFYPSRMSSSSSLIALAMDVCSFLMALLEGSTFFTACKHSL